MATLNQSSFTPDLYRLLDDDEPAAVVLDNRGAGSPVLVSCDHASNRIPRSLGSLGLDAVHLQRHIAYDIGALDLAREIAEHLDSSLIYSGYSRLVIDLNRHLDNPGSMPIVSEGTEIPGNHRIGRDQRQARIDEIFQPYHSEFSRALDELQSRSIVPVIVAIHTFTPVYHSVARPWEIGLMWDTDARMAEPFMESLARRGDLVIGNNQPYTALDPLGYAFDVHARGRGLPHLFVEVRQDLVDSPAGVKRWSEVIVESLRPLLADQSICSILDLR